MFATKSPASSIRTISGNLSEARSHPDVDFTAPCNVAFFVTGLNSVEFKQNEDIHDVEVRVPKGIAQNPASETKVGLKERGNPALIPDTATIERNFDFGSDIKMSRSKLVGLNLVINGFDCKAIRAWGDAGTTHQIVELMEGYIFCKTAPKRAEDNAASVGWVDTSATDFQKTAGKGQYPIKMEFALGVEMAQPAGLGVGKQSRTGDDLPRLEVTNQQMVAILINGIGIKPNLKRVELGSHFLRENLVTEFLRQGDFVALCCNFRNVAPVFAGGFVGAWILH